MELSPAERSKAVTEVQLRISSGAPRRDSISFLEARGIPFRDARQIVDGMMSGDREANRYAGITRIVLGAICGAFSATLLYVGFSAPATRFGLRTLGVIVGITAVSLLVRGLRFLASGGAEVHGD
jgi:hypothetical protein